MPTAAFFDLDKTILAKSSSLAFARPFYDHGLIRRSDMLRTAYAQFVFHLAGADHDQMELLRQRMSEMVSGWEVERVRAIVADTLDEIVSPMVHAEAIELIDRHHESGHEVAVISSSGIDVVAPIAERLGVDIAVGTQMEIVDGRYTGEITFYAYGPGKAEAMQRLAAERGYDLSSCYAYSDSITDLPMLDAVGNPVAVNPDSELRRIARERDWPVLDFRRPVAMRPRVAQVDRRTAVAAGAGIALGAVALGVGLYLRNRRAGGSSAFA